MSCPGAPAVLRCRRVLNVARTVTRHPIKWTHETAVLSDRHCAHRGAGADQILDRFDHRTETFTQLPVARFGFGGDSQCVDPRPQYMPKMIQWRNVPDDHFCSCRLSKSIRAGENSRASTMTQGSSGLTRSDRPSRRPWIPVPVFGVARSRNPSVQGIARVWPPKYARRFACTV
jgi:hypothetical protein